MNEVVEEAFPHAAQAIGACFPETWDEEFLDPAEAAALAARGEIQQHGMTGLATLQEELRRLYSCEDEALEDAWHALAGRLPDPAPGTARAWADYVEEVIAQGDIGPAADEPADRRFRLPRPPRASRYDSLEVANEASTLVLRANEALARRWVAGELGLPRLHLYAVLDREVGDVVTADEQRRASAAVVVMRVHPERRQPYIAASYPEERLDEAVRAAYPDLPHLLGGHFGQDWPSIDATVWIAESRFQLEVSAAGLRRVAEQLDRLLVDAGSDEQLRAAVTALGGYVLPEQLRLWLQRMRQRMAMPQLWGRLAEG